MVKNKSVHLQVYAAVVWLLLTCSLIIWWMYFVVGLISQIPDHKPEHRLMLLSEGGTLLVFLILGGGTLIYFILREQRLNLTLTQFFSAFSHDIKTSLASLRLQVEALRDDLSQEKNLQPSVQSTIARLLGDASRLQMQVENSLYLGSSKKPNVFIEEVELQDVFQALKESWPQIAFDISGDAQVMADRRALDSIFNNLVHNAIIHGKAMRLKIQIEPATADEARVQVIVNDNGKGFSGPSSSLGQMHFRQNPSSGSGLGLFIVQSLLRVMNGSVVFGGGAGQGFQVVVLLKGKMTS
ncbi:MAG: HAMP domain-containing sensor histidine kinase [Bdellovibrionota bacterium]